MKPYKKYIPLLLLALILTACGAATKTPSAEISLEGVYTSVANTLAAQVAMASATPSPQPSSTFTPLASATLMQTTAPVQNVSVPAAVVNTGTACDNAAYVSDVTIPDGTIFAPGEAFTKTWNFQNTGTCTWSTSYSIVYASGNAMGGSTTALSSSLASAGTLNVSVDMTAPSSSGTYTGYWRLQNTAGTAFGQSVYVQIVVSDDASTITPSPTATDDESSYTSTPTSAPTSTTVYTATSAPSLTSEPTATSLSSSTPEPTVTSLPTNTPEPITAPGETPSS